MESDTMSCDDILMIPPFDEEDAEETNEEAASPPRRVDPATPPRSPVAVTIADDLEILTPPAPNEPRSPARLQPGHVPSHSRPCHPTESRSPSFEPRSEEEPLMPARMLNEYVYCPRLFYYEWVEGVFAENLDVVEGRHRHARVDGKTDDLPSVQQVEEGEAERLHARSVSLADDHHGLIAKLDLIECADGAVIPVDYKKGKPRLAADGQPQVWEPERVQIAVQALVLRANGYRCERGVVYYHKTRQRVEILIDGPLIATTLRALGEARELARSGAIPPPLVDSPKCPRCSLVGICLPDETNFLRNEPEPNSTTTEGAAINDNDAPASIRPLVTPRDDLKPLYLNTQGVFVGKSGAVLKIRKDDQVLQEVRVQETCQVSLFGNVQLSSQAIQTLCEHEVPIAYFSQGGWFYGLTRGLDLRNVMIRREQFRRADDPDFCLALAKRLVMGKARNQRTMLQRNHIEPPASAIQRIRAAIHEVEQAKSLESLLGLEGTIARFYFQNFNGLIKPDDTHTPHQPHPDDPRALTVRFDQRNRRPPRDPVNALLSLGYALLTKDMTIACHAVGLDPYLGFYHQPRHGRCGLALDLMEPFRPLIADSAVLFAINTRMVTPSDFVRAGDSVALTPAGRKGFLRAYETRMDHLATHPLFGYRLSYRRMLELQVRLLARLLTGEIQEYPVFTTR